MKGIVKSLKKRVTFSCIYSREKKRPLHLVMWVGRGPARGEKRLSVLGKISKKIIVERSERWFGPEYNRLEHR